MAGPLSGYRVIEWAHYHMGPGAGLILADMGADVVHVDSPPPGDPMRTFDTLWGYDFKLPHGRNSFTEDLDRNKRSVSVDLATEKGRTLLRELVAAGDIFLTNMRQSAIDKLGLGYGALAETHPELIYAQGSGYGRRGPLAEAPGNEMMGLARGALMLGSAPIDGEPIYLSVGMNDRLGSIGLAVGILGAVVARERSGRGQYLHTSLLGWSVNLQAVGAQLAANTGQDARPARRKEANDPLYNYYRTADGVWIALGMVIHKQHFWPLVCEALGLSALADEPRFATPEARERNATELVRIFDERFATVTFAEWDEVVRREDLIATRINTMLDLKDDPQVLANGYLQTHDHPDLGEWTYVATPIDYSETPVGIRRPAPHCGEHSSEVLRDWLAVPEDRIDELEDAGVLYQRPAEHE